MIKSAIIAMTIIGCDCDARLCEFIRDNPPEWTTMEECEIALKSRAMRGEVNYPTVIAICSRLDHGEQSPVEAQAVPVSPDVASRQEMVTAESGVLAYAASGYRAVKDRLGRAADGTADLATETANWMAARIPAGF